MLMSDYTTPVVSDASIEKLCNEISKLAENTTKDIQNIKTTFSNITTKYYSVNHEPQIELPFEKEYEYVCQKANEVLSSNNKTVNELTHIFLSGYLQSGETIRFKPVGDSISNYSQLYINGISYTSDYTCRAEEGGWEKLNVLIISTPKTNTSTAKLSIDYADIPLKNFKMIVFDDLEEPVSPNINSFLAEDIDTLKYVGNLHWTYIGLCTLRRLEVTKDIVVIGTMDCPCLQELIVPNVTTVPNTNPDNKHNIILLDISNVKGTIGNLANAHIGDLKLKCSSIDNSAFTDAKLGEVNIGNSCQSILPSAFNGSSIKKLIGGLSLTTIARAASQNCLSLTEVVFNNLNPLNMDYNAVFWGCSNLKNIHFSYIANIGGDAFLGCASLTNLTFIDKSISCNLNFNSSPVITEESCLNIINSIADNTKVTVALHSGVKNHMANDWYCKEENGKYISCAAEDEGAIKQTAALIAKGGTLA